MQSEPKHSKTNTSLSIFSERIIDYCCYFCHLIKRFNKIIMKKAFFLFAAIFICFVANAENTEKDSIIAKPETVLKKYKIEVRSVKGPDDINVRVFSKTYLYPSQTIKEAILHRLSKEGISTKKKDNGFLACKGVKYNPLWHKTLDFYFNVVGSENAGTVNLLVSTGYDNYLDENNPTACLNAARWLCDLDFDIKMYIYQNNLSAEGETLEDLQNELDKLQKQKVKIENKIAKNKEKINKFEAQRIKIAGDINNLDTQKLDKEKEQEKKLQDEKNSLNYDLQDILLKIEIAESKISQQTEVINRLKEKQPKK